MPIFFVSLSLMFSVFMAGTAQAKSGLRHQFKATFKHYQHLVMATISNDSDQRSSAAEVMRSDIGFTQHISNYLRYYRSLNGRRDIFADEFDDHDLAHLEASSRQRYLELLRSLFARRQIPGASLFHFFQNPLDYMSVEKGMEIALRPDLTFSTLFEELKRQLPPGYHYEATLQFDPNNPGGRFDEKSNSLIIGSSLAVNISTVLGFIHEFGHSISLNPYPNAKNVYDIKNTKKIELIETGFEEAYADFWATQLMRSTFGRTLLSTTARAETVEAFIEFRLLFGERLHLYALDMDRELLGASGESVPAYKAKQRRLALHYLHAENMPPIFPIVPYSWNPGYMASYLMINVLNVAAPVMHPDSLVRDLIDFGPTLKGDRSEGHWRELLASYCQRFLKATGD